MTDGRIEGLGAGEVVSFTWQGRTVQGRRGDSIAMALWAMEQRELRRSSALAAPRAVWCNMGICYECLVRVNGVALRACTTLVEPGMVVEPGGHP